MKNRKLALILSFLFCGLGQLYNGHKLKAIDFIVLYTLVILGSFFAPSYRLIALARIIWPFLWVLGMVDAYTSETLYLYVKRDRKKWMLALLPGVILSAVVFYIHFKPTVHRLMFWRGETSYRSSYDNNPSRYGTPGVSVLYSIKVKSFLDPEKANKLRDDLLSKGYSASVKRGERRERNWYYVNIGEFQTPSEATTCREKLREQEGYAGDLVPRIVYEEEKEKEEKEENNKPE